METIQLRHIDRCTLNPAGLVRVEKLGEEIFVLGHGYCFYAPNAEEGERIFKLVRESTRDGTNLSTLNCDRCNLDLLEDQATVMLGEDICCPRCGVLNPSEVLHAGEGVEVDQTHNLYVKMKGLIRYCQAELHNLSEDVTHEELYELVANGFGLFNAAGERPIWLSRLVAGVMDDYREGLEDAI